MFGLKSPALLETSFVLPIRAPCGRAELAIGNLSPTQEVMVFQYWVKNLNELNVDQEIYPYSVYTLSLIS